MNEYQFVIDYLFYILNYFYFVIIEFSYKQFVVFIQRNFVWVFYFVVVYIMEKVFGWSNYVDIVVMVISCQDLVFVVCGNVFGFERFSLRGSSMVSVFKLNFFKMVDYYNSFGFLISYINIRVFVFSDVFDFVVC